MNSMDLDPSAVWARVYAHTGVMPDKRPLSRDLADWIPAEQQAAITYYHMAKLAGSDGPVLRRMAQECAGHSRKLMTLHYFLTGQRLSHTLPETVSTAQLPALLSERYRAELAAAEKYQDGATNHPQHGEILTMLAEDCRQHARQLLQLAERHI